jgi:acyl-coenzyme A thioesterase PaaI-like protein
MPNEILQTGRIAIARDGEFAGWRYWPGDAFETHSGPFYFKTGDDGRVRTAFRVADKHLNGGGAVHGGCFLTFADYTIFALGDAALADGRGVTVSLGGDFVGPAFKGDLIEGGGEIVKAGKSLIFVRGTLSVGGEPVFTFSGVIKKISAPR